MRRLNSIYESSRMNTLVKSFASCAVVLAFAGLAGCAATGANSPSARPVLYPNPALNRVGAAQAQLEATTCMSAAVAAGLTPDEQSNQVGRRAGEGAAVGGVASAVGALLSGRSVLNAGAAGAAIGGSAGAVSGAFRNDRPNATYRHFVQRCLSDKGFEVIGWN